jgi:hypothetical protein
MSNHRACLLTGESTECSRRHLSDSRVPDRRLSVLRNDVWRDSSGKESRGHSHASPSRHSNKAADHVGPEPNDSTATVGPKGAPKIPWKQISRDSTVAGVRRIGVGYFANAPSGLITGQETIRGQVTLRYTRIAGVSLARAHRNRPARRSAAIRSPTAAAPDHLFAASARWRFWSRLRPSRAPAHSRIYWPMFKHLPLTCSCQRHRTGAHFEPSSPERSATGIRLMPKLS